MPEPILAFLGNRGNGWRQPWKMFRCTYLFSLALVIKVNSVINMIITSHLQILVSLVMESHRSDSKNAPMRSYKEKVSKECKQGNQLVGQPELARLLYNI